MTVSKKAYFIDTNIFLRALIKDDIKSFAKVILLLENIKNNKIQAYSSSIVIAEIVWTLKSFYKLSKEDIIKAVDSILNLKGLNFIETQNITEALTMYKDNNVKFTDCLIYSSLDTTKDWYVVSCDTDFDKLGTKRVDPADLQNEQPS